jgi:Large polyvalent protein associated domain 29
LRTKHPWAINEEDEPKAHKRVAKNLRLDLKRAFPDIKFSVTSDFSGVRIAWYAGPGKIEVEAVAGKYQNPYFYNWHPVEYGIYESSPYI